MSSQRCTCQIATERSRGQGSLVFRQIQSLKTARPQAFQTAIVFHCNRNSGVSPRGTPPQPPCSREHAARCICFLEYARRFCRTRLLTRSILPGVHCIFHDTTPRFFQGPPPRAKALRRTGWLSPSERRCFDEREGRMNALFFHASEIRQKSSPRWFLYGLGPGAKTKPQHAEEREPCKHAARQKRREALRVFSHAHAQLPKNCLLWSDSGRQSSAVGFSSVTFPGEPRRAEERFSTLRTPNCPLDGIAAYPSAGAFP